MKRYLVCLLLLTACTDARTFSSDQQSVRVTSSPSGAWVTADGGASCKTPCSLALWRDKQVSIKAQRHNCKIISHSLTPVWYEGNFFRAARYELSPNPVHFDLTCGKLPE